MSALRASFSWKKPEFNMKIDRRAFCAGTTGLAVGALLPRYLIRPAIAADQPLLFMADMEIQAFSDYAKPGGPSINIIKESGSSPVISSDYARIGTKSLKTLLNRASSPVSKRTETTTEHNKLEFFRTHWIGFSIYVPSDWKISNTWEVLFQLHHDPVDWGTYLGGFSPVMALRIESNSDRWLFCQDYVQTDESQHNPSDLRRGFKITGEQMPRGEWTDWVIEYRPDWRSSSAGGTGVTRFWQNGKLVVDYKGPNAVNAAKTPYIKFGVYKSAWENRNHDDPVKERVYYFDEFRVSEPDRGSYELVAPGQGAAQGGNVRPMAPAFTVE